MDSITCNSIILTVGTAKLFSIYVYLKCFLEDISDTIQPEIETLIEAQTDQSNKMIVDTHEKPVEEETKEDAPENQHAFEYVDYDYADEPVEKQMTSTSGDSAVDANISLGKESRVQPPQAKTSLNDSSSNEEEPSKATTPEPTTEPTPESTPEPIKATTEPTPEATPEEVKKQKEEEFLNQAVEIQFKSRYFKTTVKQLVAEMFVFELAKRYVNPYNRPKTEVEFAIGLKNYLKFLKKNFDDPKNLKKNFDIEKHFLEMHFQSAPQLKIAFETFPSLFGEICEEIYEKLENLKDKNNDKHDAFAEVFKLWENTTSTNSKAKEDHENKRKRFIAYTTAIINADSAELTDGKKILETQICGEKFELPISDTDTTADTHTYINLYEIKMFEALKKELQNWNTQKH